MSNTRPTDGSKFVYGPADDPGQIIIMGDVTYVADADGVLRDANGHAPRPRSLEPDPMSDPALAVHPCGNPYSAR